MFWFIIGGTLITLLYYYLSWNFDYWRNRDILGPKPIPFVGTFPKSAIFLRNFLYDLDEIYREFRGKTPFVGIFTHRTPELLILDTKLVNDIFVSKFKYFQRNNTNYNTTNARLFSRNPFVLKNDEWKENRADISPAFSNMKTKLTYPIVEQMCNRLTNFIKSEIVRGDPMIDTKNIAAKFTADVICSVAYGLDANAINDPKSEFLDVSHTLFTPSYKKLWFITLKSLFPALFKFYELPFVTADIEKYFLNLTDQAMRLRKSLNEKPDDYLNFLLKLQEKRDFQLMDIAAHTITFFLEAYETSSIVLTHALYRLAQNKECQHKLRQEINECHGNIDFDIISNMKYLEQVLNETLRISPPGFTITKVCTEQIDLINYNGKPVTIEAGTVVHIPIYSIHNDPDYYPNPSKFDPERFDESHCSDLKTLRDEGIFFPFGHGPRMCLGMRFSTFQIKAAIVEVVKNFDITVNKRTVEPIIVKPKDFLYMPIHDIYLDYALLK